MIRNLQLLELLEKRPQELLALERDIITDVVALSAAIKAAIVSEDEKERGIRIILNYGHTIAHGLEAATGYERFLHGEAVAIGMVGAAMISRRLGLLPEEVKRRQEEILRRFGLPARCAGVELENVLQAMELDKKVRGEKARWVLLAGVGQPVIREDVPAEMAVSVIEELLRG
jgi:3-dehydroquinate synthetase